MNRNQLKFGGSKIRSGVRPTRFTNPVPSSVPSKGLNQQSGSQHYVMNEPEANADEAWHAGMGEDAYPLPMIQHREVDFRIADLPVALLPQGVEILNLTLAKGTAADKMRVDWSFTNPVQTSVFDIDIRVNGTPFINRRFEKPYNSAYPIEFFRKMDTSTTIQFMLVQKPGTVLVQPLGNVCIWLIVDGYRATYRG